MIILCVDPTLNGTGLAIYDETNDKVLYNDIITLSGAKKNLHPRVPKELTAKDLDFKAKMKIIGDVFEDVFQNFKIDKIVYERSFGTNPKGVTYVGMVTGLLLGIAKCYGVHDFDDVHAVTAKKQITGSGRATKEEVREELQRRYPYVHFKGFDDSDALAMGITFKEAK